MKETMIVFSVFPHGGGEPTERLWQSSAGQNRTIQKEVKLPCVTQNRVPTVASFRTWRG